jgi:hypothetical protein
MKLPRRRFLHLAAGSATLQVVSRFAWAQAFPTRPVRWIVGFAAGGGNDIVARLMGQWLAERLGQPFVIENPTGRRMRPPGEEFRILKIAQCPFPGNAAFFHSWRRRTRLPIDYLP